MSKRKQSTANNDDGDDDEPSTIDVDFDFFDPNPQTDYHALLRLLRQLFLPNHDSPADPEIDLHGLAELVLAQPLVGTTIKTDGRESDPLAVLTVLNLSVHQENPSIKSLIAYILNKSSTNKPLHTILQSLLPTPNNPNPNSAHVGFVFSERLINMPVQVVPPMYRMLADEIKWALDDNEPYTFSHLIFISRTYRLSPEEEEEEEQLSQPPPPSHPAKRQKASNTQSSARGLGVAADGIYPFHPEDEYIQKLASHTHDYPLHPTHQNTNAPPREKDAFGLDTRGRMMLLPAERFLEVVSGLSEVYGVDVAGGGGVGVNT
ncbi:hypothetical protein PILCRDRAFT_97612 [Piloderma croceum F 1598]|uniref:Protein BCP1 n=1 Tax=Piloderma croceum (strain F 1598) TaxID=765440 RepID=A0A0C3FAR7_PILCF|nr:hypothetical protein PILCRDRAFT_97612 [Piloderma croceum F 1598]